MKVNFNGDTFKKVMGIGSAIVMGVVTIANHLSDQKKAEEFEAMKKTLAELTKPNE